MTTISITNYVKPGSYSRKADLSNLVNITTGFSVAGFIGASRNWKYVKNQMQKKSVWDAPELAENEIYSFNVTPYYGFNEIVDGLTVKFFENIAIKLQTVEAAAASGYTPTIGDYVQLVNNVYEKYTGTSQELFASGLKKIVANSTTNLNGFVDFTSEDAQVVVMAEPNTDNILLPDGTNAATGDILEIVSISTYPNAIALACFKPGIDYVIDADNKVITWISGWYPGNDTNFYITYKLQKSASRGDYSPKIYYDFPSVEADHGEILNNGVISPLSLAAYFELKAQTIYGGGVYLCQTPDELTNTYRTAIDKFAKLPVNTLISLKQDDEDIKKYLASECDRLSSQFFKKERTTIFVTKQDLLPMSSLSKASEYNSIRVSFFANSVATYLLTDSADNKDYKYELSSIYAIANLCGIECNPLYNVLEPMLHKELDERISLNSDDEKQTIDLQQCIQLGSNYISYLETKENSDIVMVGDIFTTNGSDQISESRQYTRTSDLIAKLIRNNVGDYMVGKVIFPDEPGGVLSTALSKLIKLLTNLKKIKIIGNFDEGALSIVQDSVNKKQYNIHYNWLFIGETKYTVGQESVEM